MYYENAKEFNLLFRYMVVMATEQEDMRFIIQSTYDN